MVATRSAVASENDGISGGFGSWRDMFDAAFVRQWDMLATRCAEPNPFCESWFLAPALRHFDSEGRVQIFTLWDGDTLCGLMPFKFKPQYGRWWVPNFQNWLHHNAFLGVPLVRAGFEQLFWRRFLDALDSRPGPALFVHLCALPTDGPLVTALAIVAEEQNRRFDCVARTTRAFLQSDLSPAAYFEQAVRPKKRKELRRQKVRLSEEGVLNFTRCDSDAGLDTWVDEFLKLESSGWKGANGSALDCSDATRNLFIDVMNGAAVAKKLERRDLRLDGQPLAMLINLLSAPGSFSFKTAFDESFSRFSPGVLLQVENLDLLERPDVDWCDSCAAEGHPMIDSLWTGRRVVGRYSVAIGGSARRAVFDRLLSAELARNAPRGQT
ncbi:GNAT family N-acetyltransferase [Sphingorhabdus sp.]|uniref:GNAT family N-acetyltransferase n=1 Tax=Sphingorhabdus sp. TaxID=1902408 RepID=UPI00391CA911